MKSTNNKDTFRSDIREVLITLQDYFVKTDNLTVIKLFKEYLSGDLDEYTFNEGLLDYMGEVFLDEQAKVHVFKEIIIQGNQYPMSAISTLTVEDKYSFDKKKMEYRLIINKTASEKAFIGNVVLVYDTVEERQKEIDRINKIRMVHYGLRLRK